MSDAGGRRRLEAILAADVVGYSRLMAHAEEATVVALDAARNIFRTQIEANQGRVIDMAGDSVLAVFETAVGAVTAALAVQAQLEASARASSTPQDRRMRFRIGVHLGDVIEKADGTVYGDGVNVAARLQALAAPGGVSVSRIVAETVRDRLAARFEDHGEHKVKNLQRPVHVFRVAEGAGVMRKRRIAGVVAIAALVLAIAGGTWVFATDSARDFRSWLASVARKASGQQAARATIAVLPFINQSRDAQRDYFSDGITEDIIDALGRFSGVMVMSRNAVQPYRGRSVSSADISRELGVRYIVQGSVRQADGKLRVVVELSDADKGVQLWSERYDGEGAEVFDIQDRIAKNIVGALAVKLTRIEQQRVFSKPTESLEAYDLVLRARSLLDLQERRANREARALLARAAHLAPDYADIFSSACEAEFQRAIYGWIEDAVEGMRLAEERCKRVLASTDQRAHARANATLSAIYGHEDRFDESLKYAERAIEVNPSDSMALHRRGAALLSVGRIEEAIAAMETAKRFDPHAVVLSVNLAVAYFIKDRYRDALDQTDVGLMRAPHHVALNAVRAAALAQLGNTDEARRAADQVRRLSPMFDAENFGTRFANPGYAPKLQEGLRKAGL